MIKTTEPLYIYRCRVFDFDIEYEYRPNDDVYQEILPDEIKINALVPTDFPDLTFEEQKELLKGLVIVALEDQVSFDTDDAPEFAIKDVDFCFETDSD